MNEGENSLAVFIDFENLALGFKDKKGKRFEIHKVLERLVEKGKIIVKKALPIGPDTLITKKIFMRRLSTSSIFPNGP